jgi:hypothetical protein
MPAFNALLEQPFAALPQEQRDAAAALGLDEAGWSALAAQAQAAEEAQTALRQHVPLFRFNALEDELHRLQELVLDQSRGSGGGGGGGRASPTLSPIQSGAICPMCALAYVAEIRSVEEASDGHFRYAIVLTQRGSEVVVLHKRFSEFVHLRQELIKQLRANSDLPIDAEGDAPLELAAEDGGGGGGGSGKEDATGAPLSRSLSSSESMKPYIDIVRTYPFPSKAPLRAAGGASRLAATRRPVLEQWLNLVIKLARMEPVISFAVLSWLELEDLSSLSRRSLSRPASQSPAMTGAGGESTPPPMVL